MLNQSFKFSFKFILSFLQMGAQIHQNMFIHSKILLMKISKNTHITLLTLFKREGNGMIAYPQREADFLRFHELAL